MPLALACTLLAGSLQPGCRSEHEKEAESKFTRMLNDTDPQMQLAYANVLLDNFSDTKVVQENRESITKMKDSWESLQDMKKMRDNIGL